VSRASTPRKAALLAAAAAALAVPVAGYLLTRGGPAAPPDRAPGFVEAAGECGLTFRMAFLPAEQGAAFKINLYDHGCGVAVGDYDGDGHDDVYFCNQLGKNALFRNRGDGTFEDVTDRAGVGLGDRVCVAAAWADTLNVGRQDLFVTSTCGGNVLFRNNGDGTFTDVTEKAGLAARPATHSQTAVFFDYDGDGYPDLFVTNTARWTANPGNDYRRYYPGAATLLDLAGSAKEYNVLYHNNRDGTFTDVTEKAGLKGQGWGGDVAVFDYDEDGRPDLLVTNMFGASQLYHNNGDGTFTDVTRKTLKKTSWGAIGSKVFDFDNDGRLDLFIVDMHSDMWVQPEGVAPALEDLVKKDPRKKYPGVSGGGALHDPRMAGEWEKTLAGVFHIRYDEVLFGNTLFHNLGGGKFEEVSDRAGLETWWPWGVATGDFDNDGHEDVFLPSGMGYPFMYWPNALMMNNGDGTFTDRAAAAGIEPPRGGVHLGQNIGGHPAARSSRCAAVADFDGDGRLEIITNNFNDGPYYFRNRFPPKNYVAFRLTGTSYGRPGPGAKTSRDAVGALVRLYAGNVVMTRQVNPAGGYLSQSSRTVHFGLGGRVKVDRVEITWPGGARQRINNPAVNTLHVVTEE